VVFPRRATACLPTRDRRHSPPLSSLAHDLHEDALGPLAIRVAEGDYSMTKFAGAPNNSVANFNANGDGRQNNFTFSAGLVIR